VKNPLPAAATTTLSHCDPRSELAAEGLIFVQVAAVRHCTLLQQKESPLEMSSMTTFCASCSGKTLHTAAAGLHTAEAEGISSRQRGKGAAVPLKPHSGARSLARVCLEMPSQLHNTLLVLEAKGNLFSCSLGRRRSLKRAADIRGRQLQGEIFTPKIRC